MTHQINLNAMDLRQLIDGLSYSIGMATMALQAVESQTEKNDFQEAIKNANETMEKLLKAIPSELSDILRQKSAEKIALIQSLIIIAPDEENHHGTKEIQE